MTEKHPKYIPGIGWRYDVEHSMLRRLNGHDYQSRSIYMITLVTEDRKPLFGQLHWKSGHPEEAYLDPSPLGEQVQQCWRDIPKFYPEVKVLALQLMPDHLHGLLFITENKGHHLGQIINGFKVGCNRAMKNLTQKLSPSDSQHVPSSDSQHVPSSNAQQVPCSDSQHVPSSNAQQVPCSEALPLNTPPPKHPQKGMLFAPGYQDTVLTHKGQLENMFRYVAENPIRLATKREHPDLFKVVHNLTINGQSFAAIGNKWLLDKPDRLQVRCHNNTHPENLQLIAQQQAYFLTRGNAGCVVVSPCISAGEKQIARSALEAGIPLIVILENGFPPLYKPPGKYFEACANGLLLMLAPWEHHTDKRKITRSQCLLLNDMAASISTEMWSQEKEEELKNG